MSDSLEQAVADSSFQRAASMLPVEDVEQAAAHYRDCLGFTIGGIWKEVPYAIVHRGGVEIHLCRGPKAEQQKQGGVYVFVEDADSVYEEVVARGSKPVGHPEDTFYGRRDFGVRDLDGYLIMFSSPVANQVSG